MTAPLPSLRDAIPADLPTLLRLNEAGVPHINSLRADELAWFEAVEGRSFRLIEDEADDRLIALLLGLPPGVDYASVNYRFFSARFDDFLYVDRLVVAEAARRRGLAWALYEDFEAEARRRGAPRLCAEVNLRPRNDPSLTFHARFGFREIGQQDTTGGQKRASLMTKELR
jgi:uncharacterized protein